MGWVGLGWVGMLLVWCWVEFGWVGLGWGWAGLGGAEMGWGRVGWGRVKERSLIHESQPLAVEVYGDEVPMSIKHWASGVASDCVGAVADADL